MSEGNEHPIDERAPTVLERLRAAGIGEARPQHHLQAEYVHVDGQVVTDPKTPAPRPARVVLRPRGVSG